MTTARTLQYTVTLDTLTGPRQITGTATTYGQTSDHDTKAAVAQHATAGTSTPIRAVQLATK
jgi:hypothetical protein